MSDHGSSPMASPLSLLPRQSSASPLRILLVSQIRSLVYEISFFSAVATQNNRIQTFPRRLLDPRRPSRKVTAEEQEEGLFPYDPVLPNDPRRVLSGDHDVCIPTPHCTAACLPFFPQVVNVRDITTSPALLESTSLVFAYGLDLYLTRVAPSGTFDVLSKSFNKAQLVFTVSGLLLAIAITKPMVERKRLREKWYHS